ncbi:hypothetical protein HDV00_009649 [Rhizophlyctis rosea]|nr:hypothetical protein HDV00_009649 [Rhizophlyctis rosea]
MGFNMSKMVGYNPNVVPFRYAQLARLIGSSSAYAIQSPQESNNFLNAELPGAVEVLHKHAKVTGGSFSSVGGVKKEITMGFKFSARKQGLNLSFSTIYEESASLISELKIVWNSEFGSRILIDWKGNGILECNLEGMQFASSRLGTFQWDYRKFAVLLVAYVLSFGSVDRSSVRELRFV